MAADIKSHVLRRDEKGFMGIPFKRLLLGGVSGGMTLIIARFALGNLAFLVAALTFILVLTLTGPRGGIPLWQRLLYRMRGSLMLAAERKPRASPVAWVRHSTCPPDWSCSILKWCSRRRKATSKPI